MAPPPALPAPVVKVARAASSGADAAVAGRRAARKAASVLGGKEAAALGSTADGSSPSGTNLTATVELLSSVNTTAAEQAAKDLALAAKTVKLVVLGRVYSVTEVWAEKVRRERLARLSLQTGPVCR